MSALLVSLHALCVLLAVGAMPAPGRVPKVYNALITSNQNLEASKAYPVYQPVLHDPYFSYQPLFYPPDFPNFPQAPRNGPPLQSPPGSASENVPNEVQPSAEEPSTEPPQQQPQPQPENPNNQDNNQPQGPPLPPSTQSPIPVNQFGLPPQVVPLGRIDPAYDGFTQISQAPQVASFHYSYPGFRYYDPYDPFLSPYYNLPPLYRPLPNSLGPGPFLPPKEARPAPVPSASPSPPSEQTPQQTPASPPPEPDNLDVLNYASKDPSIPNVPPPPLPEGGLKTNSE